MKFTDRELIEFTGKEEFKKFSRAPKITMMDVANTDYDQLAKELQENPPRVVDMEE